MSEYQWDNMYTFCTEAYEGSGGFNDGSYLVRHAKENDMSKRSKLAVYKNYIKGIVDSLIVPVFSTEANRETNSELFLNFLSNVDGKKTNIQNFTKTVVRMTKIHGVTFTIMDNASETPDTMKEAIESRAYPYIYTKYADELEHYTLKEDGNIKSYIFKNGKINDVETYLIITDEYFAIATKGDIEGEYDERDIRYHNLGLIPVIALYYDTTDNVLPFPPVYDMCKLNWQIYNQDSEQRVIERNSAFTMLTLDTGGEEHNPNVDVGSDSLLCYGSRDKTVNKPEWISPDPAILRNMLDISNNSVAKLIEMANVIGASAVSANNSSSSGVALSYKFIGSNFAIKDTARLAEKFEELTSELFAIWTKQTILYTVSYNDRYVPTQSDIKDKISNYKELLALDLDENTKTLINDKIAELVNHLIEFEM
jgi:hypothetical protein